MSVDGDKKPWFWMSGWGTVLGFGLLFLAAVAAQAGESTQWEPAVETVATSAVTGDGVPQQVIPLGYTVGVKMLSEGVLVVGMSPVETVGGTAEPGRDAGLKTGDVITSIDASQVNTIEEVQEILKSAGSVPMVLQVMRGEQSIQLTAAAVENQQGGYQLGVWLRDSMAGIGTMTFYDPQSNIFGALGHGVNDVDTAQLMPLDSGSIMPASVVDVTQGSSGNPGALHGSFDVTTDLGQLTANTDMGLFGSLADGGQSLAGEPLEVATKDEVQVGTATILSNIHDDVVEEYTVEIVQVYQTQQDEGKNMMIKVTDQRLLDATGGIVQGMSGSPIIQNGKLIGAVTHVLVNDPTKGYGIFIENMLETANSLDQETIA